MDNLPTKREKEVLDKIKDFINQYGYKPTLREIAKLFGFKSTATSQYFINKLKEKKLI